LGKLCGLGKEPSFLIPAPARQGLTELADKHRPGLGSNAYELMSTARALSLLNSWETVRYELLNTRICDLKLQIEGSPIEPFIRRLYRELAAKGLAFQPECYLTDSWGCPDGVPVIGIPFYLADRRLIRIEEEQTGEIEIGRASCRERV